MKKLVFFNNSLNHHQVFVADEFFKLLGEDFTFVTTIPRENAGLKGGSDYSDRSYCLNAGDSLQALNEAIVLAKSAEVCIFGAQSLKFAVERASQNNCGLSFELSERWLKRGWINIFSPRLIKWWWSYQMKFRNKPFYKLNSSAFAAKDHSKLFSYRGRCYKWGYFTSDDSIIQNSDTTNHKKDKTYILWCSRFLTWKHPEIVIELASLLKKDKYKFHLDLIGNGDIISQTQNLSTKLGLQDVVSFCGNLPNNQVVERMRNSDIFLFTSDKNEGWGMVNNEAMISACAVVASDEIGSTPFLIKDGYNGLIFKSKNLNSLYEKVKFLLDNNEKCLEIQIEARNTMLTTWSPANAARNFLTLVEDLKNGRSCSIQDGPASLAELI